MNASIMLVGDAPGVTEEKLGKAFVGPAGNLLESMLLQAGISPSDCRFTNICKYRPPGNELSAWIPKGVPDDRVIEGIEELGEEIEAVNPNVIIPLGNWPLWAFYTRKASGIGEYRGYVLEARKLAKGRKVIPTFHPSYLLRGAFAEIPISVFDLGRAREQASFPEVRRQAREVIVNPRGALRESIRERLLTEGRWLCIDIEYIGKRMLCIGFAVSSSWAVTIQIESPADMEFCRSIAESGRPLLAQNAMFDLGILEWHYNWDVFRFLDYDTMVAAYNLNIEQPKDLGFLAGLYTDLHPWWEEIDCEFWKSVREGRGDIRKILPYNCFDNLSTYEIAEKQLPELATDPKLQEAFRFDMDKIRPLWEVARRGVRLDIEHLGRIKQRAQDQQGESQLILDHLADKAGVNRRDIEFNAKSDAQVRGFLFDKLGIKPGRRTPTKLFSVDNKTLMECRRTAKNDDQTRAIDFILNNREAKDIQSKFTEIEWDDDMRARCIYDATKTGTRRLSSKKFFPTNKGTNLQNIPAPSSSRYGQDIRRGFVADPGYEFSYADLKAAEFLVVAELTQDPLMLEYARMTIEGTGKVHAETASYIFKIPVDQIGKDSPHYFLGKKTRHSSNYLIGWKELMMNINKEAVKTGVWVDAATSKKLIAGYKGMHPGLQTWWGEVEAEIRRTKMLRNLFGHPRRFNGRLDQILPVAVAFVPQSTIGDYLNYGLLACANDEELRSYDFQILLQVHDAIGFQYPHSNKHAVLARVRKLMDIGVKIPKTGKMLHIPVEIQCGPSWGEETIYEDDLAPSAS